MAGTALTRAGRGSGSAAAIPSSYVQPHPSSPRASLAAGSGSCTAHRSTGVLTRFRHRPGGKAERGAGVENRAESYEVVVIGAGQAGLAMGYFLSRQRRRFLIVERAGSVASAWRERW